MINRHLRRYVAAVGGLALLLSACGGDSGSGAAEDTAAPSGEAAQDGGVPDAPAEGVTSDAIKIGWMGDATGPTASLQAVNLSGTEAYFEKVNAEGGVLGRQLDLVVKDDEYSAEMAVANFQALLNDDEVLAITNVGGSHIQDAVAADAERVGIPLVALTQTTNAGLENEYLFHTIAHYADQADVIIARIEDALGDIADARVAVVHIQVPSAEEFAGYVESKLQEAGGTHLGALSMEPAEVNAQPIVSQLQGMLDDGLNYLVMTGSPGNALTLINGLADAGMDLPIIGTHGIASLNVFAEGPSSYIDNVEAIHSFVTADDEGPGAAEIRDFIEGDGSAYAGNAVHSGFTQGWVAGSIIHQALERAAETGTVDRTSFHTALQGTFDAHGLTCDVDWSEANHSPCAVPFGSDGESMISIGDFEQWAEHIKGVYGDQ